MQSGKDPGKHDQRTWRYSTWDQAVAGHAYALKVAQGEISEANWERTEFVRRILLGFFGAVALG